MEEFGTDSFLVKPRRKMFHVVFVGRGMGDGHLFWECPFHPLQHVRELPEFAFLMSLDRSVAYSGMVGCLVLRVLVRQIPGLSLLVI